MSNWLDNIDKKKLQTGGRLKYQTGTKKQPYIPHQGSINEPLTPEQIKENVYNHSNYFVRDLVNMSEEEKQAFIQASEITGLSPEVIWSNMETEGADLYWSDKNRGHLESGYLPGIMYFGMDTLGADINKFKKYLPKDTDYEQGHPFKNELGEMTQPLNPATFKDAVYLSAARLKQDNDGLSNLKLSPEAKKFFTFLSYNTGAGNAQKIYESWNKEGLIEGDKFLEQEPSNWKQPYEYSMRRYKGERDTYDSDYFGNKSKNKLENYNKLKDISSIPPIYPEKILNTQDEQSTGYNSDENKLFKTLKFPGIGERTFVPTKDNSPIAVTDETGKTQVLTNTPVETYGNVTEKKLQTGGRVKYQVGTNKLNTQPNFYNESQGIFPEKQPERNFGEIRPERTDWGSQLLRALEWADDKDPTGIVPWLTMIPEASLKTSAYLTDKMGLMKNTTPEEKQALNENAVENAVVTALPIAGPVIGKGVNMLGKTRAGQAIGKYLKGDLKGVNIIDDMLDPILPKYKDVYRIEPFKLNTKYNPELTSVQNSFTGNWATLNPSSVLEYLTGPQVKATGTKKFIKGRMLAKDLEKVSGYNLHPEAKVMSYGPGVHSTWGNVAKTGAITPYEAKLLDIVPKRPNLISNNPIRKLQWDNTVAKVRSNPELIETSEALLDTKLMQQMREKALIGEDDFIVNALENWSNRHNTNPVTKLIAPYLPYKYGGKWLD